MHLSYIALLLNGNVRLTCATSVKSCVASRALTAFVGISVLCSDACVSGYYYCAHVSVVIWAEVVVGQFHSCWIHCCFWRIRFLPQSDGHFVCVQGLFDSSCTVSTVILCSGGAQGVILVQLLTCFASLYSNYGCRSCASSFQTDTVWET